MKKSFNKKIIVSLVSLLGLAGMAGAAFSLNKEPTEVKAVDKVSVKETFLSCTGEQLAAGTSNWEAGNNCDIKAVTIGGQKYAEISRPTDDTTLACIRLKSGMFVQWNTCTITYSLSTAGSFVYGFSSSGFQKILSTGTNVTVTAFDYSGQYPRDVSMDEGFSFKCSDKSTKLYLKNWEFTVEIDHGTVSIAKGTGVSTAFVSDEASATSGSTSSSFDVNTKVYGFVKTEAGYVMGSGWTLVSGTAGEANALWRNAGHNVAEASYSFGTINASLKQYNISWNLAGGSASGLPSSYNKGSGFSTSVEPTKRGYTFLGWTGSNGSTPQKTISVAAGVIGDKSYTANWQLNEYSITYHYADGTSNPVVYTVETPSFTLNEPSRVGSVFTGWTGSQLSAKTKNLTLNPQDPGFVLENKEFTATYEYDPLIQAVVDKIEAIGGPSNVSYYSSLSALNDAQSAYDSLIADHPEFVGVIIEYDELLDDWAAYNALKNAAIIDAQNKIDAIGTVAYPSSKSAIDAARSAFDALAPVDQDDLSDKEAVLEAAEDSYESLKNSAIANAESLIATIGSVSYPASKEAIDAADAAYNVIAEEDKSSVSNYSTLTSAKSTYATLRADAIANVETLIGNIGEVTLEKENDIVSARSAYEALAQVDKPEVSNYATLVAAEERLAELKAAKSAAEAVDALIMAIGDVTYPGSKSAIESARSAYNALTSPDQIGFVQHLSVLEAAEATYASLRSTAISNVETAISNIGEVTLEKENDIVAARSAYEALAEVDKPEVSNYATLVAAEERLAELKAAKADAEAVDALIMAIGDVTYPGSKSAIESARSAYNALISADQIGFVQHLPVLEAAEAAYAALRDYAIEQAVGLISNIGEVSYPESKDALEAAKNAYAALDEADKAVITNKSTLDVAEVTYNEEKQAGVDAVEVLINGIGEVKYTPDCKEIIDAAKAAYDALTDEQKGLVENYTTLSIDKESYDHVDEVVQKINGIGEVDLNSAEAIKAAKEAYNALSEEEKALITNYLEILVEKEQTYAEIEKSNNGVVYAIVFGTIGGILVLLALAYVLMMFVFNHWIKKDRKPLRVIKLWKNKEGKRILIAMPCKFIHRYDEEVFKSKEDALKA